VRTTNLVVNERFLAGRNWQVKTFFSMYRKKIKTARLTFVSITRAPVASFSAIAGRVEKRTIKPTARLASNVTVTFRRAEAAIR
jgi:hypothetical protein